MEEAEGEKVYTWETEYERTWEALREDVDGHLQTATDELAYKVRRKRLFDHPKNMRLGMTRHMFVVVDGSSAMLDKDLRPDRLTCTIKVLEKFVLEFFDQNPVSQLGLIVTKNGRAEKLMELSGNSRHLISALHKITCGGEPSLQNSLDMALRILKNVPSYASKEVLVVMAALTSCDPGNIFDTIEELVKQSVKCSFIGLAAELKLCKTISQRTQGTYNVVLDESQYRDLLLLHTRPPTAKETLEASLIKMGFPQHVLIGAPSTCMCHLDQRSPEYVSPSGYFCPQCNSKYCELPVECKVCGLKLVLAPHIARSHHHLFPLASFLETSLSERTICTGCLVHCVEKIYICPECKQGFCLDCDLYVHETLHNCPGCTSTVVM